jgi:RNA polymerase primary sigma factor
VSANIRFVVSVAKQYQNYGISLPDLINEGNVGLIKAAARFDETRGFKFISYSVWWIRQSIMQAISDQARVVRLPQNKIGTLNKIRKAQGFLEQQLERMPTNSEIASHTEIKEEEINVTLLSSGWQVSTDSPLPGQEDLTILDALFNPDDFRPDDFLMAESLQIELKDAMKMLTERERNVVSHFFGIAGFGTKSMEEIGEKYDLTRERVRQIKEKAIRKMRVGSQGKKLMAFL